MQTLAYLLLHYQLTWVTWEKLLLIKELVLVVYQQSMIKTPTAAEEIWDGLDAVVGANDARVGMGKFRSICLR